MFIYGMKEKLQVCYQKQKCKNIQCLKGLLSGKNEVYNIWCCENFDLGSKWR